MDNQSQNVLSDANLDVEAKLLRNTEVTSPVVKNHPYSAAGNAFVRKAVHPPSAIPEYRGMPTDDARTIAPIEFRGLEYNGIPQYYNGTVTVEFLPGTLAYLIPSGARVHSIGLTIDPTGVKQENYGDAMINTSYDFTKFASDANLYRMAYNSTTFYLNATAFNNTGSVTVAQFNPNILFKGLVEDFVRTMPVRWHQPWYDMVTRGLRLTRVEKPKNWFDDELWDRIEQPWIEKNGPVPKGFRLHNPKIYPNTDHQYVFFDGQNELFPDKSQLLQNSPRAYAGKAADGAFVVQKHNSISPHYLPGGNMTIADQHGLYDCFYAFIKSDGAIFINYFVEPTTVGTTTDGLKPLRDTAWCDMTWSWVIFDGLQYNGINPPAVGAAMSEVLLRKVYKGIEVQPSMRSAWSVVGQIAPEPDQPAMIELQRLTYSLKDGLPASYNFWGALGTMAASGLKEAGGALIKSLVGGKSDKEKEPKAEKKIEKRVTKNTKREESLESQVLRLTAMVERLSIQPRAQPRQRSASAPQPIRTQTFTRSAPGKQKNARQSRPRQRSRSASRGRRVRFE